MKEENTAPLSAQPEERYVSPFSTRYASDEMQALFSAEHKFRTWRDMWIYLAESEQALGLNITDEQLEQMRATRDRLDLARAAEYEKQTRHDVMAHIRAWGEQCPKARGIIHLGATSCYVGDNTDILILRSAMKLIRARVIAVIRALRDFAYTYRNTPCLAFTHFQSAQPTTVGKRACLWISELCMDVGEIDHFLAVLRPLGCKGTTGTQASCLELFQGDWDKVRRLDRMIAEKMGFDAPVPVSGQTYSRKTDAMALNVLSGIAQSAHKFSNDLRLLAHKKEMEEPFEKGQVGSSAMAYKRNPMRCERMAALSRFLISDAFNGAQTAAEQWFERTLDDSANRRISIAEGFLCCDAILALYLNIASGMVVYDKMMLRHLSEEMPFMATENIMMDAAARGGDRQELHERIRVHSQAAAAIVKQEGGENDLVDRIAGDPVFRLSREEILARLDPAKYVGCSALQTEAFLAETVDPILEGAEEIRPKEIEV